MKRCVSRIASLYAGATVSLVLTAQDVFAARGVDVSHGAGDIVDLHAEGHPTGGGLPQLDVSTFPSQLFWLFVSFGIMYMIFSRRTLPEISGVLENRQSHIQGDLET